VKEALDSGRASESRPSIFQALLSPNEKDEGYVVPTVDQLKDEAYSILAAAADTTGNGMTVAAYSVVNNPVIYERLTKELESEFPNADAKLNFVSLEKLPYLASSSKPICKVSR
jgi:cytochrome P450